MPAHVKEATGLGNENVGAEHLQTPRVKLLQQMNSDCLLYTSPSPRDLSTSRMPSSA